MRRLDRSMASEDLFLQGALTVADKQFWRCHSVVDKYEGDILHAVPGESGVALDLRGNLIVPEETVERRGNLLVIGGASVQWQTLIGNGTATAAQPLTFYNNANAYIGVGASTTAAADTQTDLITTPTRKAMDATYPLHTDTTGTAGSKSITFRSTFATGDANIAWQEWGIFNASTGGRMLNRKVESLGTKTSAATWVLTITLSLA